MNSFADFFWSMIVIYFWIMVIYIFIRIFADIFRRDDLSGAWKAIWIIVLIILPFLGAIVYMIARPVTDQDRALAAQAAQPPPQHPAGYSAADEVAKLTALRDSGAITPAEYEAAKAKALT